MLQVNVEEIENNLMLYLRQVEAGETLVILRDGKPLAELKPAAGGKLRPFGLAAGEFMVPDDFDDPLPEDIIAAFEGQ
jgi:antitoxin (DNA-binding transcriptional repressor) of toxin-antitoxin stability system